jgi:hypothetical protein
MSSCYFYNMGLESKKGSYIIKYNVKYSTFESQIYILNSQFQNKWAKNDSFFGGKHKGNECVFIIMKYVLFISFLPITLDIAYSIGEYSFDDMNHKKYIFLLKEKPSFYPSSLSLYWWKKQIKKTHSF